MADDDDLDETDDFDVDLIELYDWDDVFDLEGLDEQADDSGDTNGET